ncbi:hypothetical protein ACEUBN_05275 [Aeromonas veronii]
MLCVFFLTISTIVILGLKPVSNGDKIVRFVIQYLVAIWLLLPFILSFFVDVVKENLTVNTNDLLNSYTLESVGIAISVILYIFFQNALPPSRKNNLLVSEQVKFFGVDKLFLFISFFLIFISCIYSILDASNYHDANLVGSASGIGGSFGLPLYEPLLIAILSAFVISTRCKSTESKFALVLILVYGLIKFFNGGRFAIIYPFIPLVFVMILRAGRLKTFIKIFFLSIIFMPVIAVIVIGGAMVRDGDGLNFDFGDFSSVGKLLLIHFYLKFSGVTNATFLSLHANAVSNGEAITSIMGPLFSFIPRLFWPTKPISGSLDGTEGGLPYRIAAQILNYPEWGNVALSPFTTSDWIYGWWGVGGTALMIAINMFLASKLIESGFKGKLFFSAIGFYMLGLPHLSGLWNAFAPGLGLFSNSIFMMTVMYLCIAFIRLLGRGQKRESGI